MSHVQPHHAKEVFTKAALARIAAAITQAEHETHAEIRIAIHDERETDLAGKPIAEVAKTEFAKLGMHKTARRNGLLLMILYSERKFFVYADEGIHAKVQPETWTDIASVLSSQFKQGHFEDGVLDALHRIAEHLRGVLPRPEHETNELSNEVSIG